MAEDDPLQDPTPTQETKPAKGKPITIPVPKRDEIEDLLSRSARTPKPEVGAVRLKVGPDAPPAKRNEDGPVEELKPLKDQGDPLSDK
jgi:hypothetical protein